MLKALFPTWPAAGEPKPQQNLLEEQFTELRDTWQASMTKWTELAKDAAQGRSTDARSAARDVLARVMERARVGVMDAALQRVLEGPRYATLWDLDRKLLELQKLHPAARQGSRSLPGRGAEGLEPDLRALCQDAVDRPGAGGQAHLAWLDRPLARRSPTTL